ncbi:MAG: HlyD family efflux transporter periplasmic adaptor subunit [Planctomycetes bacterium]|nr:HlyD family efflux transporter periplasmic adaptor subunit [Planctomycetota bacterium]
MARARRELAMSEAWLGLERAREEQVRLHEHPSQLARLELELRSRALSAELQAVEREVALSRRDLELREAEARVRDATERLARLERDRAALEVRSPAAGLWTTGSWEPADEVRSGQVLGRVADTSGWAVSARLPLGPGGAPEAGGAVTVRLAAPLEMDLEGRLVWVSRRAAKDKEAAGGARLEARIEMPAADPRLRAGLPCKVLTPGLPRRLLVVAAEALRNDAEGRHVLVEDGGAGRRVKVEATERADGRFEVKGTLSAGDRVLVPEPPAEGGAPR